MMMHVPGGQVGRFTDTVGIIDAIPTFLTNLTFRVPKRFWPRRAVWMCWQKVSLHGWCTVVNQPVGSQIRTATTVSLTSNDSKVILADGQPALT